MADEMNVYGIKYEVDIESLKTSTAEAGKQIKLANAQFNEASSKLDNWATSVDGVSAKIKQLNTILEAEKSKLAQNQKQYNENVDSINKYTKEIDELKVKKQKAIEQYGKESTEVKSLTSEINKLEREQSVLKNTTDNLNVTIVNQQAKVNRTEKAIGSYESQLTDLKEAQSRAEKSGKSLEDELNDMKKASDDVTDSTEEMGNGFTVLKGTLANLIAQGISSFISGIKSAVEESREFRMELGKLEATAQTTGSSFDNVKANLKEVNAITNDTGAGVEGLNNLMSAGFDGKVLDEITEQLLGASIKWKDTLKFEGLSDGLQETLATGSAVGPFAELIERAGGSLENFDKGLQTAIKSGNEQNYILEYLSQYGLADVKKAYEENNKTLIDSANANFDYLQSMATLSEKVEPILTSIKAGFVALLNTILEATGGIDGQAIADKISAGFSYFIDEIVPKIIEGFNFIVDHGTEIISVIAGIGAGFLAFKTVQGIMAGITMATNLYNTAVSLWSVLTKKQTLAQAGLNATMLANPIGIVVGLIAGLVVAFVTLWNKSEAFRNFWINLWEAIKGTVSKAVDIIVTFFTKTVPEAWNSFIESTKKFISNITTSISDFFTKTIPEKFNEFLLYVDNLIQQVQQFFQDMWNGIISFFTETIPAWIDNVIAFFEKIPYYIGYMVGYVIAQFIQWGLNLWNFATVDIPKFINEVIKWFASLPGKIWEWLVQTYNKVVQFGIDIFQKGKEAGSKFISSVVDYVSQLPGKVWNWLITTISKIASFVSDIASKGVQAGSQFVNSVVNYIAQLPGKVWSWLTSTASKVLSFGSDLASKGAKAGRDLVSSIVDTVSSLPGKMASIGRNLVEGLWNGISDMAGWIGRKIQGFTDGVLDGIKSFFGIHSPSRETYWIGDMLTQGLGNAISNGTRSVVKKAKSMASNVLETMQENLKGTTLQTDVIPRLKRTTESALNSLYNANPQRLAMAGAGSTSNVSNLTLNQYNYSPKAIDSLETYRNTQKALKQYKVWQGGK